MPRKLAQRLLFGGNLLRQPAFIDTPRRVIGDSKNSDAVIEWCILDRGMARAHYCNA
jgi:CDP-6-deoxy-D-xylo-4-hexulose-3-dehydrase